MLLVQGPAGSGKTALIERFLAGAGAVRVLRAGGQPSEAGLALGVVDQFLRRAGAAPPAGGDVAAAGARVLDVLAAGPSVAVLDDAQWIDRESLDALVYAARRLVGVPVLLLVAARGELHGFDRLAGAVRVSLGPLDLDGLRALAGAPLTEFALRTLLRHTEGNPGHAHELLEQLRPAAWTQAPLRLPAPLSVQAEVREALAGCPDVARLIEAAAVLGPGCALADAAALAGLERGLPALEDGCRSGLIREGRRRGLPAIEFASTAVAAAVHDQLGPAARAGLHRGAAALDAAGAVWHLAAAAEGPDEPLAARLERCAGDAARPQAAAALISASRLSADRARREERLLRAVDWMLLGGDASQAQAFEAEVADCEPSARRESILGQLAMIGRRVREASHHLQAAWELCDAAADPGLAATIAHRNAFEALVHLRDREVMTWARRALELAPDDPLAVEWRATLALARWRLGERAQADALLTAALSGDDDRDAPLVGMRAWLRFADDDLDGSRRELAAAAEREIRLGALEIAVVHLNVLVRAHFAAGDWEAAEQVAERAVRLGSELEDTSARVFAWWPAQLVPLARGEWARAERLLAHAVDEPTDAPDRVLAVGMAQALAASARGNAAAVLEALAPVAALSPCAGLDAPGFWPWQPLYAAALVASGRHADADAFLRAHERLAGELRHGSMRARLASVRGRLEAARGDVAGAEAAFELALAQVRPLARPYERATIELAAAQFFRRTRRRRRAVELLTAAAGTFASLGARPALTRCEQELGASGLQPSRGGRAELTPRERMVAELAAAGATNRAVADELQLSVKTVEIHLGRVYSKLAIKSRAQLAQWFGSANPYARSQDP